MKRAIRQKRVKQKFTLIIERDAAGWFVSEVVELPGCHTQARDVDQLIERTREVITGYEK